MQRDYSATKNNKDVIANIMFYCAHSKSFSGDHDDAMLMNNILGSYIKENCQTIVSTVAIDSFIWSAHVNLPLMWQTHFAVTAKYKSYAFHT